MSPNSIMSSCWSYSVYRYFAISNVKIFKRLLLPQFSANFNCMVSWQQQNRLFSFYFHGNGKYGNWGESEDYKDCKFVQEITILADYRKPKHLGSIAPLLTSQLRKIRKYAKKKKNWLFKTNYGRLKLLLTQDHMGLEISKRCSCYSFIQSQANCMRTLLAMGEQLLLYLAIGHVLKMLCHFDILKWESVKKILKC